MDDAEQIKILKQDNSRLLKVLSAMCLQYLSCDDDSDGLCHHDFISAGENALEILKNAGMATTEDSNYYQLLLAKLTQNIDATMWIPITNRLPIDGRKVIAFYRNENGKDRRIMAYHASQFSIESEDDDQSDTQEYHEGKDQYFVKAGWYENNEFDDINYGVDGNITHWMELPPSPIL